jgi:ribose/xylose/arabinose/galactoside ABC-type transport system permease subunit
MAVSASATVPSLPSRILRFFIAPTGTVWIGIAILLVIAALTSETFVSGEHLLNVARQATALAIATVGQILVIISGGLDLSNGAVITVVSVVASNFLDGSEQYLIPVVLLCLTIGVVVGLFNGLMTAKLGIPPLIGTLGTFGILKGAAYVLTGGAPKGSIPGSIRYLGSGAIAGFPISTACALVFVAFGAFLLTRTIFGRQLVFLGANPSAARLSGVPVERIIVLAYVFSGISAAFAGLLAVGYTGVGSLSLGEGYNLDSITGAVIGGTALTGGSGSVIGGVVGVVFLALLTSFLRFLGLSYSGQLIVQGAILVAAVILQARAFRR